MAEELSSELSSNAAELQQSLAELSGLAGGFGRTMTSAFRQAAVEGKRFDAVLKNLALGLSRRALSAALAPLTRGIDTAFSSLFSGLFSGFSAGGVLSGGRVRPFASGGVVAAPSYFPMAGGLGLAGEAGPEAILPLARGADGRLGVRAGSGGQRPVNVTFNVTSPDAASFRRSEAELTAMLARTVSRGRRGL